MYIYRPHSDREGVIYIVVVVVDMSSIEVLLYLSSQDQFIIAMCG